MAITVLPQNERRENVDYSQHFGNALSTGLQQLAQHKIGQMQQRHQASGLRALGIPEEQAAQLSMLSPDLQKAVLNDYLEKGSLVGSQQAQPQQPGIQQPEQQQDPFTRALSNPRLKPEQRLKVEALKQRRELNEAKESLPVYKDIVKANKAAHESEKTLARMEKLIDSGKLSNPLWHSLLKTLSHGIGGFGIDLHSLENPESQEFTKLSNNFVKNAKDVFGGRITDTDLKAFMQTVPTLSNSDAGKRRIISVLKAENEAAKIKKQALDAIIKQNGGRRPANLELLIDEAVGPQLDALAEQFINNKPAEDQSLFGKIVGAINE